MFESQNYCGQKDQTILRSKIINWNIIILGELVNCGWLASPPNCLKRRSCNSPSARTALQPEIEESKYSNQHLNYCNALHADCQEDTRKNLINLTNLTVIKAPPKSRKIYLPWTTHLSLVATMTTEDGIWHKDLAQSPNDVGPLCISRGFRRQLRLRILGIFTELIYTLNI